MVTATMTRPWRGDPGEEHLRRGGDAGDDPAALRAGGQQRGEGVVEQHDVGDVPGDGAAAAHRHPDLGRLQRAGVVDAVADHRDVAALPAQRQRRSAPSARARPARRPSGGRRARPGRRRDSSCSRPACTGSRVGQAGAGGERGDGVRVVAGEHLERDARPRRTGRACSATSGRSSSASATTASGSSAGSDGPPVGVAQRRAGIRGRGRRPGRAARRRSGARTCAVRSASAQLRARAPRGRRAPRSRRRSASALQRSGERERHLVPHGHAVAREALGERALVRFGAPVLRAIAPRASRHRGVVLVRRPAAPPRAVSRPVVSVPVLSVQTTSTLLTDSTALTRCTSAPCRRAGHRAGGVGERDEEEQAVGHQARTAPPRSGRRAAG